MWNELLEEFDSAELRTTDFSPGSGRKEKHFTEEKLSNTMNLIY